MLRNAFVIGSTILLGICSASAAATKPSLSASEIVAKNVQARGGLQAWRSVQTLTWTGKMGAGGNQRRTLPTPIPHKQAASELPVPPRPTEEAQLPFVMEMERARKSRLELQFNGKTAIQVYDGSNGWKVRPYLNRLEVEPYTQDELKKAEQSSDIDGPLVDYTAKGTQIDLDGTEKVDDRDTYKLKLSFKDGRVLHVWVDAQTFLETKIEGTPRRLDGREHPVEIYYRDYRQVAGLEIPFVLETHVLSLPEPEKKSPGALVTGPVPVEKIEIDKVEVNPKLDASLFTKPVVSGTGASAKLVAPAK